MDELAVAQCSSFVKHHEWISAMYFVVMFEFCSIFILMHLEGYLLIIADRCHICFCLPFPNRASDSGDLYINFKWNLLIFPVALLYFHVEARFNLSFANHAYASHTASRIAYHVCILLFEHCTWLIVFLLLVCIVWVEPRDEFANEEPVEFAFEDPVNSDNFAGKTIIPSKSLLSLLASCSLFCYAYAAIPTTCLSCLQYC